MTRFIPATLLAGCLVVVLSGCGPQGNFTPVEGTVTGPDGKPMPDVLVQFNPEQSNNQKVLASSAVTDASGHYVLKCDNGATGAVVGPHRVVLIDNALGTEDEPDPAKPHRPAKRPSRISAAYLSPTSTPLQVTVESGKKTYDLKVERR